LQAPVPAGAWEGELNATVDGSECPQGLNPFVSENEDCLYLNVYTPQVRESVKFFVNGGVIN
jgi:carboxylesterase type B